MPSRIDRPTNAGLQVAEVEVRTALSYGSILVARLALARTQRTRCGVRGVSAGSLTRVAVVAVELVAAMDVVLERMSPELSGHAASIASIACQRDMASRDEHRAGPPLLHLIDGPRS